MSNISKTKKCRRCGEIKLKDLFVDVSGIKNPRGGYCLECHLIRDKELKEKAKEENKSKLRKLKIIYGKWWRHYCLPLEFSDDLYSERDYCPYCGNQLPPHYLGNHPELGTFRGRAHLDHMDPLELGGEDSIRNVVYVCDKCNYKKGKQPFTKWIKKLNPKYSEISRKIYESKHGHAPENFVSGDPNERCDGIAGELCIDEDELRKMYPAPMVSGPPENTSFSITMSVSINVEANNVNGTEKKR